MFCRLAVRRGAVPSVWSWPDLLRTAATLLPYAFEKSDAQEKYGAHPVLQDISTSTELPHRETNTNRPE